MSVPVLLNLVSSPPIWCDRSRQQAIMDGLPCGKTALLRQINEHPGECHILFSRDQSRMLLRRKFKKKKERKKERKEKKTL